MAAFFNPLLKCSKISISRFESSTNSVSEEDSNQTGFFNNFKVFIAMEGDMAAPPAIVS